MTFNSITEYCVENRTRRAKVGSWESGQGIMGTIQVRDTGALGQYNNGQILGMF